MPSARFDVLGIGNAIVDVIARTEEDFLLKQGMHKGTMALIDEARAQAIYDAMGPAIETSGGSAANTIVGLASLGSRSAFIGKVKDDELGRTFAHDIRAAGAAYTTPPAADGPSTARCYVLVTPDGERTMNTYLGAAQDLHPADIDADLVAASAVLYLEGYLWDPKNAKDAFIKAAKIAHEAERTVALSLSDAFCVDRWRAEFLQLMRSGTVDLIFANETELHSLYQTSDFDTAVAALRADVSAAVVTRSEKGCIVLGPEGTEAVPAFPIERVVDTTGAGDLFAAGFLSGLARGADDRTCGRRAGGGRGYPASRRAAGGLAARPRARKRAHGLTGCWIESCAPT
jgi:sugar/nucleoside kinase (ribokinase family)